MYSTVSLIMINLIDNVLGNTSDTCCTFVRHLNMYILLCIFDFNISAKCPSVLQVCIDFVNFTFTITAKYMNQFTGLFKYMIFCIGLLTFAPGIPCLSVQKRPVCGSLCATPSRC